MSASARRFMKLKTTFLKSTISAFLILTNKPIIMSISSLCSSSMNDSSIISVSHCFKDSHILSYFWLSLICFSYFFIVYLYSVLVWIFFSIFSSFCNSSCIFSKSIKCPPLWFRSSLNFCFFNVWKFNLYAVHFAHRLVD